MAEETKRQSLKDEAAEDGTFFKFYSQKYYVKIKQRFAIDKVLFAFVEKNTKGKGFDVYMNTREFQLLCRLIKDGTLKRKIETSQSKYPDAWVYNCGNNGEKSIAFGKGDRFPVVLQGKGGNKQYMSIGIDYFQRLEDLVDEWEHVSANYFATIREAASKSQVKFSKEGADEQQYFEEESNNKQETPKKEEPKPAETVTLQLIANSECCERKQKPGDYAMTCVDRDGVKHNVVVPADAVKAMNGQFVKFVERSKDREVPLEFKGNFTKGVEGKTEVFYFMSFTK